MKILGIETSCDETAAAIVERKDNNLPLTILSSVLSTSLNLHAKTGGIIPEVAARQQLNYILPVLENVLQTAKIKPQELDAIAVTYGPGLIGSLLVGVETAKTLSYIWKKPLIPVNHLYGHIYANWISPTLTEQISFPAIALIISGGHTDLVYMESHGTLKWIGGTRDDAAGECFDKCARLLGYDYPGGPKISRLAIFGKPNAFLLPRPMIDKSDFDFSFSGLKTAFMRLVYDHFPVKNTSPHSDKYHWQHIILEKNMSESQKQTLYNICASLEQAIIDVLIKKTMTAAEKYNVKSILVGGGVASNKNLRTQLELNAKRLQLNAALFVPPPHLCTDNGAMIASAALFHYHPHDFENVTANPQLYFD